MISSTTDGRRLVDPINRILSAKEYGRIAVGNLVDIKRLHRTCDI